MTADLTGAVERLQAFLADAGAVGAGDSVLVTDLRTVLAAVEPAARVAREVAALGQGDTVAEVHRTTGSISVRPFCTFHYARGEHDDVDHDSEHCPLPKRLVVHTVGVLVDADLADDTIGHMAGTAEVQWNEPEVGDPDGGAFDTISPGTLMVTTLTTVDGREVL